MKMNKDNWYKEIGSVKEPTRTALEEIEDLPIPNTKEAEIEYEKHLFELLRIFNIVTQYFFTKDTNLIADLSDVSDEERKKEIITNNLAGFHMSIESEIAYLYYYLGFISEEDLEMELIHNMPHN